MSDKQLLSENTVRRFMKLANIDSLTNNFIAEAYGKDDETNEGMHGKDDDKKSKQAASSKPASKQKAKSGKSKNFDPKGLAQALNQPAVKNLMKEEDDIDEGMYMDEDDDMAEGMYMDEDDDLMEQEDDMEDMGMDMDSEEDEPMGEADVSLTEEEAQLLIDLGERLKEAMAMEDDEMPVDMGLEAGDEEEDAPDEEEEEDMPEEDDEELQEDLVQEVLRRVTKRIIREKTRG